MKTLWVDFLGVRSLLKIFLISSRESIGEVRIMNISWPLRPFLPLVEIMSRKKFSLVDKIAEGEEMSDGVSLQEIIQLKLTQLLKEWVTSAEVAGPNERFCRRRGLNIDKLNAHLKEYAYPYFYRPVQMIVLSERFDGIGAGRFLVRKSPHTPYLLRSFPSHQIRTYQTLLSPVLTIKNRPEYYYDLRNREYYAGRFSVIGKLLNRWSFNLVLALIGSVSEKKPTPAGAVVATELIQGRFNPQELNDLYWYKDSGIDTKSHIGICFENYDAGSLAAFKKIGLRLVKVFKGPKDFQNFFQMEKSQRTAHQIAYPKWTFIRESLVDLLRSMAHLFVWGEGGWLAFQRSSFFIYTKLWEGHYRQLNVRLLWSMYDDDPYKLSKAQALENCDGLYTGSHWTNYPMYKIENQKCADVLIAWGPHFVDHIFTEYPYLAIPVAGYPMDYYFDQKRERATDLRQKYSSNVIISYLDNYVSYDSEYNPTMQNDCHRLLIRLLKRNPRLMVFLKPKKHYSLALVLKDVPELQAFMDSGRVIAFLGNSPRTKYPPAEIGMASDLTIGLGMSTAANEAFFAGGVAFHADLTHFVNNSFLNKNLGHIVFREIDALEKAIEEIIDGKRKLIHDELKKHYFSLDPFQDGQAYRRSGFIMKQLHQALSEGKDREAAVKFMNRKYQELLNQKELVLSN